MNLFNKPKKEQNSNSNMYLYTEKELNQYEKYIMKQFGEYKEVFHEIYSPDIHLDIIIVPPTKNNDYYKLITMGMGAYKMNVPPELKQYELERAELVLYLPANWNIKSSKIEDYWPIEQLKTIARLPIQNNTWLGYGHTISANDNNKPYASNTKFCSMMLVSAPNKDFKQMNFQMKSKGKINFYQLFPLYKEELEYKQKYGTDALLDRFNKDIIPIVNNKRENHGIEDNNS